MKFILAFIFLSTTLLSSAQDLDVTKLFHPIELKGDSGYFQKKEVYQILDFLAKKSKDKQLQIREQGSSYWKETDTLGKFIFLPETNRYLVCLNLFDYNDNWDAHCVLEIEKKGQQVILKNHRFFAQGNYSCCWHSNFDGFVKWNRFVVYKLCGTGSSMCSSNWIVFNDLTKKPPLEFYHDYWIGGEDEYYRMDSKTEWTGDSLLISYTMEQGIIENPADEEKGLEYKTTSTKVIDIKGIYKDGVFVFEKELPDLNFEFGD